MSEEVKVTRKYQVTIPESVRSRIGIKIGDKLVVKSEDKRIIMETTAHISNPSDTLWNLFGKPMDIDATRLVEESWNQPHLTEKRKQPRKQKEH